MDGSETKLRSPSDSLTPSLSSPCEDDGNTGSLIQVRAQAMTIDESTGLWRRTKGNPAVTVNLRKDGDAEYSIVGLRIQDRQELFNCKLKPSTHYQRGDATFHHWNTDNQRHGLTFLHMGDARKFERLVNQAIHEISPPRGSLSDEEIFVKTDTLASVLDCETHIPLRPHKPKRLTEEYRNSTDSKDSFSRHKNSTSSSEEDSRAQSRRGSPLTGAIQSNDALSDHKSTDSLQAKLLQSCSKPKLKSAHQPTHISNHDSIRSTKTSPAADDCEALIPCDITKSDKSPLSVALASERGGKPNIYVRSGSSTALLISEPALPRRANAAGAAAVKPTNHLVPRVNQYSDYRNDYYIKQEQKRSTGKTEKCVTVSDSGIEISNQTRDIEEISNLNLKSIKNTPPLPRKKKRHRPGMQLCCFKTDTEHSADERV